MGHDRTVFKKKKVQPNPLRIVKNAFQIEAKPKQASLLGLALSGDSRGHVLRACSEYAQGVFRVCSGRVQSMLRTCHKRSKTRAQGWGVYKSKASHYDQRQHDGQG
jgi:hypothetical protein